ncbi:MAG: FtsX-like permease family protein [Nevskiaceae bacterium]|nr:MAG: FtsX-like permease family protein [Nevskiaceae bacterium]
MKYLPLIWAALGRRKPRTILTGLSIAVAFLLYGMLNAVNVAFNNGVEIAGVDRLVTTGRYSITQILPYGHEAQIRSLPGVEQVAASNWFGGYYQDQRNFFPQFAVEQEAYLSMYPEIVLPAEQKQAFFNTRTGVVVAKTLAERFHWKLGDKIPMQAGIWPLKDGGNVWTFDLVGIFDTANPKDRSQYEMMLIRYDYFDEARQFAKGTAGWYVSKIKNANEAGTLAKQIDALFANSPNETRTDTEKAFNQGFIKQLGDIGLIIRSILGAVFFTLLFLTGNTMMQSVRERIPELAVLKTLGYSDPLVLALVLGESLLLTLIAALVGLGLATILLPGMAAHLPGFSGLTITAQAAVAALGIATLLAIVVGLPPALRAMRLDIVTALSGH